ncbi:MAG: hypothetical protein P4M09_12670 [Devosia sp.]|nr:hypothetical protein [Devosia sp.]
MRRLLLCLAILSSVAPMPPALAANLTAAQLGEIFCIGRLANEMAPLETLLTADLARRIADAEARNAAFVAAHPGKRAPLADGVPWQGKPAYARECQMVGMSGTAEVPLAVIAYGYADPAQNFSDRLELNFVDGNLRLDNIDYGRGGDLKSTLAAAFGR